MRNFLIIIFISTCSLVHGQKIKLGFRSGVSFSNFYAHQSPGEIPSFMIEPNPGPILPNPEQIAPSYYYETNFIKDMRIGFFSCFDLQWEVKKHFAAQVGLGYSQKGIDMDYKLHSTSTDANGNSVELDYQLKRNLKLDYVVIPITLQYDVGKKERFYVTGGIYNSFAVNFLIKESSVTYNKRTVDASGNTTTSTGESRDTNAYANIFDLGLLVGLGVNWPLTQKMNLGIDIRSSLGLMSVPARYEEFGFLSFSETTKNISFETGVKLQYILK